MTTNNRGVGPVIGVILMIAITVILAASIGAFVLGLGGEREQPGFDCEAADYISHEIVAFGSDYVTVELERSALDNTTRLFLTDSTGQFADEQYLYPPATRYNLDIETSDLGMTLYLMNGSDIHETCTLEEAKS